MNTNKNNRATALNREHDTLRITCFVEHIIIEQLYIIMNHTNDKR